MAQHTVTGTEIAAHITTTANTIETIDFDSDMPRVEIVSHDGQATIWYTVDGTDPQEQGKHSYVIPAGAIGSDERWVPRSRKTTVKILADGVTDISVYKGA